MFVFEMIFERKKRTCLAILFAEMFAGEKVDEVLVDFDVEMSKEHRNGAAWRRRRHVIERGGHSELVLENKS